MPREVNPTRRDFAIPRTCGVGPRPRGSLEGVWRRGSGEGFNYRGAAIEAGLGREGRGALNEERRVVVVGRATQGEEVPVERHSDGHVLVPRPGGGHAHHLDRLRVPQYLERRHLRAKRPIPPPPPANSGVSRCESLWNCREIAANRCELLGSPVRAGISRFERGFRGSSGDWSWGSPRRRAGRTCSTGS
eukprot:139068-Prorocentrum_minimum.AAC.3